MFDDKEMSEKELEIWRQLDNMDAFGEPYRPFERWNQLSPSEEAGEQEFK